MKHFVVSLVIAAGVLVACATPSILTPATGPGTTYPCGVTGVVCLTPQGQPSGYCCDQNNVCGGQQPDAFQSCPVGTCCYEGSAADFGARRQRPQTRSTTSVSK